MLKRDKHFETELIEKEEVIQKFLEIEASRSLELMGGYRFPKKGDGSTTPHCTCMNAVVAHHLMPSDGRHTTRCLAGASLLKMEKIVRS